MSCCLSADAAVFFLRSLYSCASDNPVFVLRFCIVAAEVAEIGHAKNMPNQLPTELESFEGLSHFISNLFRTCQSAVQAMMADIEAIVKTDPLFSPSRIIQRRTSQLHQVQHRDLEHKGIFTCAMVNAGDSDTVWGTSNG